MSPDGWLVLAILAAAIVAFASNRVPADAVALAVLLALAISGVVSVREALAGFSDSSVLMIAGLFIVGQGLVSTGVAAALGAWLAKAGRGSETRLITLLMVVVATIGAFMSSTGIVAIFIPVVLALAEQTGSTRARLMMPLSVAALISGLMTLIATAPDLVVSAALADRGIAPLGFFELTPIGVVMLVVGSPRALAAMIDRATTPSATGFPGSKRSPKTTSVIATTPTASTIKRIWVSCPANSTARSKKL